MTDLKSTKYWAKFWFNVEIGLRVQIEQDQNLWAIMGRQQIINATRNLTHPKAKNRIRIQKVKTTYGSSPSRWHAEANRKSPVQNVQQSGISRSDRSWASSSHRLCFASDQSQIRAKTHKWPEIQRQCRLHKMNHCYKEKERNLNRQLGGQ